MHTETVQISLHALKLKNVAGFGKGTSDPYAVLTLIASEPSQHPVVLGRTEVLKNNLSPHWVKTFETEYEFGKPTRINVGVYDEIRKANSDKPMGTAVFELGEILGSRGNIKAKKLQSGGTLFCRVQKAPERHAGTFHLTLRGVKIKNVEGMFGKSDPFFELAKLVQSSGGGPSWQVVHRSQVKKSDLNPKWEPISIGLNELCNGDRNQPLLVVVKDWEKKGKHNIIGSFETTVNAMINAKVHGGTGDPQTIDTSKAFVLKKKGKPRGNICVTAALVEGAPVNPQQISSAPAVPAFSTAPFSQALTDTSQSTKPLAAAAAAAAAATASAPAIPFAAATALGETATMTTAYAAPAIENAIDLTSLTPAPPPRTKTKFVDYLSGGLELQMSVAIDFTGSNGDPRLPGTLHHINPRGALNDYEKAISAVGEVVAKYDSDQKFPVLGFGAKYGGVVQHCFRVGRTPEADGVKGIIDAYRETFKTGLVMSGPTVFAEVIQVSAMQARSKQEQANKVGQQFYHILLILTDGAVSDISATKEAIQRASDAPLSIVIIGIGTADFSAMQFLDDFQTEEGGAGRDICQFVEFQKYAHNKIHLTQATLDEIPGQVVGYFQSNGIAPLQPLQESKISIVADEYNEDQEIDLTLAFEDNGEIRVANGGVVDGTGYGNYDIFSGYGEVLPERNSLDHRSHQQSYQPPSHQANLQGTYSSYSQSLSPQQPSYQAHGGAPQRTDGARQPQVFHVQLPPGVVAGQQIQITHPKTGQPMVVSVPPGVAPGGLFSLPY